MNTAWRYMSEAAPCFDASWSLAKDHQMCHEVRQASDLPV